MKEESGNTNLFEEELVFNYNPPQTFDIETCGNKGCLFNKDGECTSDIGGCYGYIKESDG